MNGTAVFLLVSILLLSDSPLASGQSESGDLARLVSWMTGTFSSAAQAQADTDYFDIRLRMAPIWKERTDGFWLYVEQARGDRQDRPYRQRVYRVTQRNDSTFESAVFTMSAPLRFAGDWRKEKPLASITPDSLVKREGCSIFLMKRGMDLFEGSTQGAACPSELRGAAYATSEVKIWKDRLLSWDRGWDKDGTQAWGAEKGGYVFVKVDL